MSVASKNNYITPEKEIHDMGAFDDLADEPKGPLDATAAKCVANELCALADALWPGPPAPQEKQQTPPDPRAARYREIMLVLDAMPADFIYTEKGMSLATEALTLVSPEMKAAMNANLKALGLEEFGPTPKTLFVDDDGRPAFTLEQVAAAFAAPVAGLKVILQEEAEKAGAMKVERRIHILN